MKPVAQKGCCCAPAADEGAPTPGAAGPIHDPVCGMVVDPATALHRAELDGRTYYFCCSGCRTKFLADTARYVNPGARSKPECAKCAKCVRCARYAKGCRRSGHCVHLPHASANSAQ